MNKNSNGIPKVLLMKYVFQILFAFVFIASSLNPAIASEKPVWVESEGMAIRGEVIQIKQGNVGTFHELRIGVTNIIKADYIDDAGIKKHGLIAVLTLFIEGNPPQEKDFKVHAGQKIMMDKYSVYVEEIRGTVKGLVTLRIKSIKGDGSN